MFEKIKNYIENLDINEVSESRKVILEPLVLYLQKSLEKEQRLKLQFICTHNSRRSHLGQIWAQTIGFYYKIEVNAYSGGTEETAIYPTVLNTLREIGFETLGLSEGLNPVFGIKFSENEPAMIGFSKKYDSLFNPSSSFGAVLTCTEADKGCPFIAGAEQRIAIPYLDPKLFDKTELEAEKYAEKSREIATEMKYVFVELLKRKENKDA